MSCHILSISHPDNCEFYGVENARPPGLFGYQLFIFPETLTIVPNILFTLRNLLVGGLLVSSLLGVASNLSGI